MKESTEKLLKDFYDCVESLKSPRCEDPKFREVWCKKFLSVKKEINDLDEDERKLLEKQYEKDFRERNKDVKFWKEHAEVLNNQRPKQGK